jgi:pimeloyl-ACP methyl ester carboxylesterase
MPFARSGKVELYYEAMGDGDGVPLLLVMGLGAQLVSWPDEFCMALCDRGFRVVRFDNRDVGLSTKFDDQPVDVLAAITTGLRGEPVAAPYLLSDMASDAAVVLDAVGWADAHIVGASMGGMIAQAFALAYPQRTRTLTSIMSTTGDHDVGQPHPEVLSVLTEAAPDERDAVIEQAVVSSQLIGSPGLVDEEQVRERAGRAYDRCYYPVGVGRQLVAILASPSRSDGLRELDKPALVIHGEVDPLVDPSGGRRTAEVLPDAELLMLPGMGHDLPESLWPQVVEAITALAARSGGPEQGEK